MFDIIDGRGKRSLRDANDAVGHVFRYEAVVGPDDADNGNVDVWKYVRWRANNRKPTHNKDEYRHNHKRIWPAQC